MKSRTWIEKINRVNEWKKTKLFNSVPLSPSLSLSLPVLYAPLFTFLLLKANHHETTATLEPLTGYGRPYTGIATPIVPFHSLSMSIMFHHSSFFSCHHRQPLREPINPILSS